MQRTVFVLLCVVALGAVVHAATPSNHGLSSTFTAGDAASLTKTLQTHSEKLTDIHTAFYATQALHLLNTNPSATKSAELCTLAKDTLKNKAVLDNQDAESIHHAAAIIAQLKCDVAVDKTLTDTIKTILQEGDSVPHYFHAVQAALLLRDKTKKDVSDDELTSVIEKVSDLTESDGTVRASTSDKDGSLYNAGLAIQLYAKLASQFTLSEQDHEHLDEITSKIETLLDLANEGENTLSFSDDASPHSPLATTSALARGFQALSAALKKPLDISPAQTGRLGEYFLSHRHAGSVEDAYHVLTGLKAVQNSPKAPLALTLERSSIPATAKGAEGHIKVKLADIFDAPIPGKISLVKANAVGKTDVILANQEVQDALNFLAAKPEQGFYSLEFRAVPVDTAKFATIDSATRRVKVIGSVSVSEFELTVSDSKEARSEGSSYKAEFPSKVEHIQATYAQFLHVQFKVRNSGGSTTRPLIAQQAFVRLAHKSGEELVFVATANENKAYSVVIDIESNVQPQLRALLGWGRQDFSLSVVVGDAFIQNPVSWNVAPSVSITFKEDKAPAARPALAAKPVIIHEHRAPAKRGGALVSTVFTGVVLAPIAFLLIGFAAIGANIKKFPTGADFIPAVAFIGLIGAILALIALFWLSLNLVQTITYLSLLAIPTVFFGQQSLRSLARKEKLV